MMRRLFATRCLTGSFAALAVGLAICLTAAPASSQVIVQETILSVYVHDIPGPPAGDSWDSAVGTFFGGGGFKGIYPDIRICVNQPNGYGVCADVCPDAQLDKEVGGKKDDVDKSRQCKRSLNGTRGLPLRPNDPRVTVSLYEVNPDGQRPIATVPIPDPERCHLDPCSFPQPRGPVVIGFDVKTEGTSGTVTPVAPKSQTPGTGPSLAPLWTAVWDEVNHVWHWWIDDQNPTGDASEIAEKAAAASQRNLNACLLGIPQQPQYSALRSRMPMCQGLAGKALENCMFQQVLSEDDTALTAGYACKRQYQSEVDDIGRTTIYVKLKGYVCPWLQVISSNACR